MPTIYKNSRAYGETAVYGGFTPVGTIISVMGNDAPTNYLKCDGSLYSISAYPELAAHFKDQFGSINYFGGNGTTTFGVPDLRGEFLRGAGTNSHTNQGSGSTVGAHQDATAHIDTYFYNQSGQHNMAINNPFTNNSIRPANPDSEQTPSTAEGKQYWVAYDKSAASTEPTYYTSRPTNTSVLYCIAYKNIYIETSGGGSGTGGSEVYETTATLDEDINDTTTVLAADLPGVDFADILINVTLIRDAKGTLGLVTAKNGTTDVTVTTVNTTTPTKELTQAQYDLLPTSEKNNGTTYYITDSFAGGTYVGAYETIYSTTERVVGSYKGKPLYQVTLPQISMPNAPSDGTMAWGSIDISAYNVENVIAIEGWHTDGTALAGVINIAPGQNSTVFAYHHKTDKNINIANSFAGYNGRPTVITIRYTKTTDTVSPVEYAYPNDYSTTEKIVGTWIDGRPIYQKTVALEVPANSSGGTSTVSVPGLDIAVSVEGVFLANNGGAGAVDYWMSCSHYNSMFTNTANTCICWATDGSILLRNFSPRAVAGSTAYVTARYTKSS